MTRKDYQLIASTLADAFGYAAWCLDDEVDCYRLASHFADALATTNPNFDRQRFLDACGVKEPEEDENN